MRAHHLFIVIFFSIILSPVSLFSASIPSGEVVSGEIVYKKITSLRLADVQKLLGRKLRFKEKISFLVLKHQLRHEEVKKKKKGKTSLIFGIAGLTLLIIGLFVPIVLIGSLIAAIVAIALGSAAKKGDPTDKNGDTGKLLGWINLGLIGLLAILVVIAFSTW